MKIPRFVSLLDARFLGNRLRKFYRRLLAARSLGYGKSHSVVINYDSRNSLLKELFYRFGSDKGAPFDLIHPVTDWPAHTYADLYGLLFEPHRNDVKLIFENGIGTNNLVFESNMGLQGLPGASLRAWEEYFPNAEVFGADIDESVLFSEGRIVTCQMDQLSSESIANYFGNIKRYDFDLIIDDGLHTFTAGVCLFENSFTFLRSGGTYIIEDVTQKDKLNFLKYFEAKNLAVFFFDLHRPVLNLGDNSVIVIRKV